MKLTAEQTLQAALLKMKTGDKLHLIYEAFAVGHGNKEPDLPDGWERIGYICPKADVVRILVRLEPLDGAANSGTGAKPPSQKGPTDEGDSIPAR